MFPFSLRIVELESVIPHECVDQRRVERLALRLQAEEVLLNPLIVTPMNDRYVGPVYLLDE